MIKFRENPFVPLGNNFWGWKFTCQSRLHANLDEEMTEKIQRVLLLAVVAPINRGFEIFHAFLHSPTRLTLLEGLEKLLQRANDMRPGNFDFCEFASKGVDKKERLDYDVHVAGIAKVGKAHKTTTNWSLSCWWQWDGLRLCLKNIQFVWKKNLKFKLNS